MTYIRLHTNVLDKYGFIQEYLDVPFANDERLDMTRINFNKEDGEIESITYETIRNPECCNVSSQFYSAPPENEILTFKDFHTKSYEEFIMKLTLFGGLIKEDEKIRYW